MPYAYDPLPPGYPYGQPGTNQYIGGPPGLSPILPIKLPLPRVIPSHPPGKVSLPPHIKNQLVATAVVTNALDKSMRVPAVGFGDIFSGGDIFGGGGIFGGGSVFGGNPFASGGGGDGSSGLCIGGIDSGSGLPCDSGGGQPPNISPISVGQAPPPPSQLPGGSQASSGFNLGSFLSQITSSVPGIINAVEGHPQGTGPGFSSYPPTVSYPACASTAGVKPVSGIGGSLNISTNTLIIGALVIAVFFIGSSKGRR